MMDQSTYLDLDYLVNEKYKHILISLSKKYCPDEKYWCSWLYKNEDGTPKIGNGAIASCHICGLISDYSAEGWVEHGWVHIKKYIIFD